MNHPSKLPTLPALTIDLLIGTVVFTLSLWLWLKQDSIGMFARDTLQGMGKDVLYDTLNREDLNWRRCHTLIADQAVKSLRRTIQKAFVVDDSIVQRFGKKMPGISSHFDHTTGRHMMGQQVLTLGLSCEDGFVPLDNELYTSQTNAQALAQPFNDGRSTAAKRHRVAIEHTKPTMVASMIRRALRAGIDGHYLLADAWFGSKAMIRLCQETNLVAILRMKKSKLKYRASEYRGSKCIQRDMDVKVLYQSSVRKQWKTSPVSATRRRWLMSPSISHSHQKTLRNGSRFAYCLSVVPIKQLKHRLASTTGRSFYVRIQR